MNQELIHTSSSLASLLEFFDKVNQETLVIFGIEYVLLSQVDDHVIQSHPYVRRILRNLQKNLSKDEYMELYGCMLAKMQWHLVDKMMKKIWDSLYTMKVPMIAMTSGSIGRVGKVPHLEIYWNNQLQKFGFDFCSSSPFEQFSSVVQDMTKFGIVFEANATEAEVLQRILQLTGYSPQKILYIDARLQSLESLREMSCALGIEYVGLHYTAVKSGVLPRIKRQVEKVRFKVLQLQKRWIGYQEM